MNCSACRHENPIDSLFCEHCGVALEQRCPTCGTPCGPSARFCRKCGTSLLAEKAAEPEARKVVTIVFADLIGSTSLHERLDPESVSRLMDRYHRTVRAPVEAHGGTVVQLLGDGVMCAFGVPRVAEDDAIRAVRAAIDVQRAFREFAREEQALVGSVGLRVAVNTGEVVVSDDYAAGIGDPLNVAARLQQEARDGDVLIGEATQRLVRELVTLAPVGKLSLKGRAETVAAFRVVSLERPAGASATPFVGRDDELRRIMAVHESAVASRRARLAVILGSPGLGKSRLMDEVARRLGDGASVLTAQCDAAGGATFAPIAKALRTHLRVDDAVAGDELRAAIEAAVPDDDAERGRIGGGIVALIGGTPASPEETFFVVRRFLSALATVQPVVLAIDDLQWAEPLLLDLTEHLIQWTTDVPLLVLVAARPELRDTRSSLAAPGGLVTDVVTLAGLDAGAAMRLAANVIGAGELPAAVAGRVLATSEGNPLFVGELVRMLVHDGALKREGERWTASAEVARLEMPPTIQALLAARIERLRPEDRTVLERAAIVGRQFSRAAVTHLLPREITDLDARLEALRRSELIEPDAGWFLGEPALRFHHVLIRDAAYRRVLKNTRAELHARFADWLESRVGDAVEHDETMGWHLEQAHQHLRELGPVDAHGRALGERAARYLAAAGRRALARDDLSLAGSLLGRALDRLDPADPGRADLILDWCEALLAAGDVGPAARAIDELGRLVDGSDRLRAWHACFAGQLAALTDPQALRATADAVAAAADVLASAGDATGEAKAHSVHAGALARLGRVGACEAALDRALAAARRAGDRRRSNGVLAGAPLAALWGPSPVTRASGRCLDVVRVLRITQGAPAVEAVALRCQGVLEALRGRMDAARRMIAASRKMVEELGITQRLLEADVFAGLIELLEGDAAAAERVLRSAYDGLRGLGHGIDAAQAAALLGRALLALDRAVEAEALSHESEALAGDDLRAAIAWRGVRAEALARRGEHAAAIDFARAAVELAAATDALLPHADARLALAAALRAAGRGAEAAAEEARAIELWEAKGATVLAERARRVPRAKRTEAESEGRAAPEPRRLRRIRPNAATANAARLDAAMMARDADALPMLFADDLEGVDHQMHHDFGRQELLATFSSMMVRARDLEYRHEPLATLGDSLALCRNPLSASGTAGAKFDVGAYDIDQIVLVEVDAQQRRRRAEYFAAERLRDAVVRLYERHADLLPDGPERTRAAATARSVGWGLDREGIDRWAQLVDPEIDFVDFRPLGFPPGRGAERYLERLRTMRDLAADISVRIDDVVALHSDVLCVRWAEFGTVRATGGAYERHFLVLFLFGPKGLATRVELFAADREDDALARCEELTAEPVVTRIVAGAPVAAPKQGRVRPNAATVHASRLARVLAARDFDGLPSLFAENLVVVEHRTGADYDREGTLSTYRALLTVAELTIRLEPIATLGDSLALVREFYAGAGVRSDVPAHDTLGLVQLGVGAHEHETVSLFEVDALGRAERYEIFDINHLGAAVACLYGRYADLLPDGAARARAAATARSVARLAGRPEDWSFAPDVEADDHRSVGFGALRGADVPRAMRALFELIEEYTTRFDDVLGLRSDALLVRYTHVGIDRTGGAFERQLCELWAFGPDGLISRWEQFDGDHEADSRARFDALAAGPAARIKGVPARAARVNAATASSMRVDAALNARDADALPTLLADEAESVDHSTGATFDREGVLATYRAMLRARDAAIESQIMATLGEALALGRSAWSASGTTSATLDVGPFENDNVFLAEVDVKGLRTRTEFFASHQLGDAVARLYTRYAELEPEGPARVRAAATARSVATWLDPITFFAPIGALAPEMEFVDHRPLVGLPSGIEGYLAGLRSLREVATDLAIRVDEILDLRADAFLVRWTQSGTVRSSGGAYERPYLLLFLFGSDGLATRCEMFAEDRDAEALARFDELTADRTAPRRRRVRPNAATANAARIDAAIAGRDADALPTLFADEVQGVEHTTGVPYDREGALFSFRSLLRAGDPTFRHEPLAALGDALALCRAAWSASALNSAKFDVGAYEGQGIDLIEVDAQGRRRAVERFAVDRLGDAIVRLYERYADVLPDGAGRVRAAATARSLAASLFGLDFEHSAAAFSPSVECVDHRILGTWAARGVDAILQHWRSLVELTEGMTIRVDTVLDLRPDALVVCRTTSGIARTGGGAFDRSFIILRVFGSDGLQTRVEVFDADREDEALARLDGLTVAEASARITTGPSRVEKQRERRIAANAAMAAAARLVAATAARDGDAFGTIFAEHVECLDHVTGATYDRAGYLATFRTGLKAEGLTFRHEPLASIGESLALYRSSLSASRFAGRNFDVGPYERERVVVMEADAEGRVTRQELFEGDRLGDGIVRLYTRYADLAPEGSDRARAAATARTVTTVLGPLEGYSSDAALTAFAADLEFVDHRRVGLGPMHGADSFIRGIRTLLELADDVTNRIDDILGLRPDALLAHWINRGRDRASGGEYERPFLLLWIFGPDGLITRGEQFDLDREDEALARFDELTRASTPVLSTTPRRPVRANAATANIARCDEAVAARDLDAITALTAESGEYVEHTTGVVYDREGKILSYRALMAARDPRQHSEPLATLGDRLALCHLSMSASALRTGGLDVGPFQSEEIGLIEVDSSGRRCGGERFAVDRLGDAIVRLYERHAALLPEGPARARAAATARSVAAMAAPEIDCLARAFAPAIAGVDHRILGTWSGTGIDALLEGFRAVFELSDGITLSDEAVLDLRPDALLVRRMHSGIARASGGAYERPFLLLLVFGMEGLVTHIEWFDTDRADDALARFDELTAPDPLRIPANAATRATERHARAVAARDWEALESLCAPTLLFDDRRRGVLVTGDRDMFVASGRFVGASGARAERTTLATAGDRLALEHVRWRSAAGVAPFEVDNLAVVEVDAEGRIVAVVLLDADARRAASIEMLERYARSEAARWAPARLFELRRALADHDLERVRAVLPRVFFFDDHRRTGLGRLESAAEYIASLAALYEQSPDAVIESLYEIATSDRGVLAVSHTFGTLTAGGPFESVFLALTLFEGERLVGAELFELEDLDAARARFDALRAESAA